MDGVSCRYKYMRLMRRRVLVCYAFSSFLSLFLFFFARSSEETDSLVRLYRYPLREIFFRSEVRGEGVFIEDHHGIVEFVSTVDVVE